MKQLLLGATVVLLCAVATSFLVPEAGAQSYLQGSTGDVGPQTVPTSTTAVATATNVFLQAGEFYNTTGSTITLTLTDQSTNCSSAACSRAYPIAAGQEWYPVWPNVRYAGGLTWKASATGLTGWLKWGY